MKNTLVEVERHIYDNYKITTDGSVEITVEERSVSLKEIIKNDVFTIERQTNFTNTELWDEWYEQAFPITFPESGEVISEDGVKYKSESARHGISLLSISTNFKVREGVIWEIEYGSMDRKVDLDNLLAQCENLYVPEAPGGFAFSKVEEQNIVILTTILETNGLTCVTVTPIRHISTLWAKMTSYPYITTKDVVLKKDWVDICEESIEEGKGFASSVKQAFTINGKRVASNVLDSIQIVKPKRVLDIPEYTRYLEQDLMTHVTSIATYLDVVIVDKFNTSEASPIEVKVNTGKDGVLRLLFEVMPCPTIKLNIDAEVLTREDAERVFTQVEIVTQVDYSSVKPKQLSDEEFLAGHRFEHRLNGTTNIILTDTPRHSSDVTLSGCSEDSKYMGQLFTLYGGVKFLNFDTVSNRDEVCVKTLEVIDQLDEMFNTTTSATYMHDLRRTSEELRENTIDVLLRENRDDGDTQVTVLALSTMRFKLKVAESLLLKRIP